MAGHSHWAKVKRAKGAADAKRGKLFSKLSKEITVATKLGGGDPNFNPRLRQAILTAKSESVPAENIARAIKKGTGEIASEAYEELIYEGYAAGGIAVLVEATTDNKNRTAAEMRSLFSKNHGNLAGSGSVAWMFHKKGLFLINNNLTTEDALLIAGLEAGVEDVKSTETHFEVTCPPDKFEAVGEALKNAGISPETSKLTFIPENMMVITDPEIARQVITLYEALDDHDDVQNVHANFDIPEEILAQVTT